jgi:hypothetical protein
VNGARQLGARQLSARTRAGEAKRAHHHARTKASTPALASHGSPTKGRPPNSLLFASMVDARNVTIATHAPARTATPPVSAKLANLRTCCILGRSGAPRQPWHRRGYFRIAACACCDLLYETDRLYGSLTARRPRPAIPRRRPETGRGQLFRSNVKSLHSGAKKRLKPE